MNRTGKTLVALLAALVMVAAATYVRREVIDDETAEPSSQNDRLTIACIGDLEAVCDGLPASEFAVVSMPDDITTIDGLVTFSPLPELLNERATFTGTAQPFRSNGEPLASSPLQLLGRADRIATLRTRCGGTVDWKCFAANAGREWSDLGGDARWGTLRVGHANPDINPDTAGIGLIVIGSLAAALLAPNPALDAIDRADFDTPEFRERFGRVERDGVPNSFFSDLTTETPYEQFVGTRFAAADAIVVAAAEIARVPSGTIATALPEGTNAVVTFAATQQGPDALSDDARATMQDALTAAGWTESGTVETGVPRGGVLDALLRVWKETVR